MTDPSDLIGALRTPIADALREAGHDELAAIAVDAAKFIADVEKYARFKKRLEDEVNRRMTVAGQAISDAAYTAMRSPYQPFDPTV